MQLGEKVEIPLDYLVPLHPAFNRSFEKMKEILGESAAMMFFAVTADNTFPRQFETQGDIDLVCGKLTEKLEEFGYSLEQTPKGRQRRISPKVPTRIDNTSLLGRSATYCPMSQMVPAPVRSGPQEVRSYYEPAGQGRVTVHNRCPILGIPRVEEVTGPVRGQTPCLHI